MTAIFTKLVSSCMAQLVEINRVKHFLIIKREHYFSLRHCNLVNLCIAQPCGLTHLLHANIKKLAKLFKTLIITGNNERKALQPYTNFSGCQSNIY